MRTIRETPIYTKSKGYTDRHSMGGILGPVTPKVHIRDIIAKSFPTIRGISRTKDYGTSSTRTTTRTLPR